MICNNKGFTLVELIVAITVAVILSTGMIILVALSFRQNTSTRADSYIQIEAQTISETVKPILMSCSEYHLYDGTYKVLEIKTRYRYNFRNVTETEVVYAPIDGYYYFIVDKTNKKAYLQFSTTKVDACSTDNDNYLGQYITDFTITPTEYKIDEQENSDANYVLNITYWFREAGQEKVITNNITMRSH